MQRYSFCLLTEQWQCLPMGLWEKGMMQGGQGNWEGGERRREGRGREGSHKFVPPPTYENVPTRLFCHNMIHVS